MITLEDKEVINFGTSLGIIIHRHERIKFNIKKGDILNLDGKKKGEIKKNAY